MVKYLFVFIALFCNCHLSLAQLPEIETFKAPYIVEIKMMRQKVGSGFVIGHSGRFYYAVTAAHVINGKNANGNLLIKFNGLNTEIPAAVFHDFSKESQIDLAIIKIQSDGIQSLYLPHISTTPNLHLPLVYLRTPEQYLLGNDGRSFITGIDNKMKLCFFNMDDVAGGDSGGALFIMNNVPKIVGMVIQRDELCTAIPIKFIKDIIQTRYQKIWQLAE